MSCWEVPTSAVVGPMPRNPSGSPMISQLKKIQALPAYAIGAR